MMPDLGKYGFAVLMSYGSTILLLALVAALSIRKFIRTRRALAEAEARMGKRNG